MRTKGKLASWNKEKGFGFITPMAGGKQLFIHSKAFSNRRRPPVVGEIVTYAQSTDKQGRPCAVNATLTGDKLAKKTRGRSSSRSILVASVFLVFVGLAVLSTQLSIHILSLYGAASVVTFVIYALDKSAAQGGGRRIQERTLHLLSLIGGWPVRLSPSKSCDTKPKNNHFARFSGQRYC